MHNISKQILCVSLVWVGVGFIPRQAPGQISQELDSRLDHGDTEALEELLQHPENRSVRKLVGLFKLYTRTTKGSEYPGYRESVLDALRSVEGHAEIIGQWIEDLSDTSLTGRTRAGYFEVLGELATGEAEAVAGGFIEDTRYQESKEDVLAGGYFAPNYILAVDALAHMELPDAPIKGKKTRYYKPADRKVWQQWWREKEEKKAAAAARLLEPGHAPPGQGSPTVEGAHTIASANPGWPWKWILAIAFTAVLLVAAIALWRQRQKAN